jgi:hypothetical protein
MSIRGENIITLPDRSPEITTGINDVRKIHFSTLLAPYLNSHATARTVVNYPIHQLAQHTNVVAPVVAASWDNLSIRIVPTAAAAAGLITIDLCWGHTDHRHPADAQDISALPAASQFIFGNIGAGAFMQPPGMVVPCPFVLGISRQSKPKDLYGGRPQLFILSTFTPVPGTTTSLPATAALFRIYVHGDMSVKGSDVFLPN